MTLITVEGTYKDGKIHLAEVPPGVRDSRVLVTFLPPEKPAVESKPIQFGQFRGPVERMTSEEDFKIAEWHPTDKELDGD